MSIVDGLRSTRVAVEETVDPVSLKARGCKKEGRLATGTNLYRGNDGTEASRATVEREGPVARDTFPIGTRAAYQSEGEK